MAAAAIPALPAVAAGSGPLGWVVLGGAAVLGGVFLLANQKKRSEKPIAKRDYSNTRKEAYEKAKRAGGGKEPRGPEDHGHGPHYHPGTKHNEHDHYYFPQRRF
ncbi:RHS repeat-associated core domain-containing protein [Histomonas meleagridis]|uniref:RHS repeat-associated core domain-containing protein n=1 Tax=Histomonas meleagridis TaxID=135588 RepID=UPI00355A0FCE|nr:RHS repeat-associated core domain-containing protein [Histomonas meleagridis]KAH0800024.1 RHS repeat-associated core domain-containing protein [Histomonas meleagridis]